MLFYIHNYVLFLSKASYFILHSQLLRVTVITIFICIIFAYNILFYFLAI